MELYYASYMENGHEAAMALLGYAWSENFSRPMPEIRKTLEGKPYFAGACGIHFSLSHSKTFVLCAIGKENIGADIESVRPIRPSLPGKLISEAEAKEFSFFESWVLRESFIKYCGRLDRKLRDMSFSRSGEIISGPDGTSLKLYASEAETYIGVCAEHGLFPKYAKKIDLLKISR